MLVRAYVLTLTVVATIALLMSVNYVATVIVIFTFGLGVPLAFAATLVPYMIFFLPTVAAASHKQALLFCLPVSFLLSGAWAFLPNWQTTKEAAAVAARLSAGDHRRPGTTPPRTFELRRPQTFVYGLGPPPLPHEPCSDFCRSLLLGGEVDWVRIVMPGSGKQKSSVFYGTAGSTLFKAASGAACAVPGEPGSADERCVEFSADHGRPAELVAEITESTSIDSSRIPATAQVMPKGERVVTFRERQEGGLVEALRHTETHFSVISPGSVLSPGMKKEWQSGGIEFMRGTVAFNKVDFPALLRSVGYRVADFPTKAEGAPRTWRDPPSTDMARQVLSLLNLPGKAPFNAEQSSVINDWISHARSYKEWPRERIEFLRRIVRDERVTFTPDFDQVFSRNPDVSVALMPDVLDRLEKMGEERGLSPGFQGGIALRRIDPKILRPYASRILAIARKGGRAGEVVLSAVGRVGVDPAPFLRPMVDPKDGRYSFEKIRAACFSEDRWGPTLVPLLRALVTQAELARPRSQIEDVLKALLRHGDREFVEQAISRSEWSDGKHLRRSLLSRFEKYGATERMC